MNNRRRPGALGGSAAAVSGSSVALFPSHRQGGVLAIGLILGLAIVLLAAALLRCAAEAGSGRKTPALVGMLDIL
jgi:hypothetical protein